MAEIKKYNVMIVSPTPFYYHAPLYRRVSENPNINLTVFYCSEETLQGKDVSKMYNVKGQFAGSELLQGYKYQFLKNYSPTPSYFIWPFGLMNFGIWSEIRKGEYDIIILQSWTNLTWWIALLAGKLFGVPVFFMTDENILARDQKPPFKKILKKLLIGNIVFKMASGFLTSGNANKDLYRYFGVSEEKIFSFSFAWGYEDILKKSADLVTQREAIRQSFSLDSSDFMMLYVGRLAREKNIFTLLDAYQEVKRKNKKLFFAGQGPLKNTIERYVKEKNIPGVSFMGFQDRQNIFKFYTAADLFILPSSYEPWGIVVNEAMCFSLPVIASNRVGAAWDMVKEGENGFIFKYNETKDLAEKMNRIAELPEEQVTQMRNNSKRVIETWLAALHPAEQIINGIKAYHEKYPKKAVV